MKLLRLTVEHAMSCGGLLDKIDVDFESEASESELEGGTSATLSPHCLIGQNGSGKSQLLQLLSEIFQSAWYAHAPNEERDVADKSTLFSVEYLVSLSRDGGVEHVCWTRMQRSARRHRGSCIRIIRLRARRRWQRRRGRW